MNPEKFLTSESEEPQNITGQEVVQPIVVPEKKVKKIENEESPIEHIRLNSLKRGFQILHKPEQIVDKNGETKEVRWLDLYKEIGEFDNSIDLSDKIRNLTIKWVENKIPELKENILAIKDLSDKQISSAIAKNWFSEVPEVEGQRKEVLLATMASIVKRVETRMWQKKLEQIDKKDLEKMGIDKSERELLVELLKTGVKANPLFIRFLAYSRLTPEASEKAELQKFEVPEKNKLFSLSEMFPKETRFLSERFKKLYEGSENQEWSKKSGAESMVRFLKLMSEIYAKGNTSDRSQELQEQVQQASDELIKSGFPIAIIPSTEGMYKERHIDPEIRVCLKSKDCIEQDKKFENAKVALVDCLEKSGLNHFSGNLRKKHTKSLIEIGEFGVNLAFKGVAQESQGTNVLFVNEQRRSYDVNFPEYLNLIAGSQEIFSGISDKQKQEMARMLSMLHEFSHLHIEERSEASQRLGPNAEAVLCEVEAESIYRGYLPDIIKQQGLIGTKEQWAYAMLAGSLQMLKDPDSYSKSAGFTLKSAIDKGAISWSGNRLKINDFDLLFKIQQESAEEVLNLFKNPDITAEKAKTWIDKKCSGKIIDEIIKFVVKQP